MLTDRPTDSDGRHRGPSGRFGPAAAGGGASGARAAAAPTRALAGGARPAADAAPFARAASRRCTPTRRRHSRRSAPAGTSSSSRHRLRQDALLQPAGPRRHRATTPPRGRSTSSPPRRWPQDQLVELRALVDAAELDLKTLHLRRRHAAATCAQWCARPGQVVDHQPGHAPRRRSSPTTPSGSSCSRTCASWSSTSCTPIAASSAATWPTSSAACAASAATTARTRSSSAPAPPSPTRATWRSGCIEAPVELVDDNGAPSGRRHILVYNPPVVNEQLGIRGSALLTGQRLAERLIGGGVQTIAFARSRARRSRCCRPTCARRSRRRPAIRTPSAAIAAATCPTSAGDRARPARRPGARRGRDQRARAGDRHRRAGCRLSIGYPGTIASTWQQMGRAGRRVSTSLSALICSIRAARPVHGGAPGVPLRAPRRSTA